MGLDFWLGMLVLWAGVIYMLGGFLWTCVLSGFVTWLEFWLVCCVWVDVFGLGGFGCGFGMVIGLVNLCCFP